MNNFRRIRARVPAWNVFVVLLVAALGSEYWDKDAVAIAGVQIPWPRFVVAMLVAPFIVPGRLWRWSALFRLPSSLAPMMIFWIACGLSVVGVALTPVHADIVQYAKTLAHLTMYVVFVYLVVKSVTWARLFQLVRAYYILGIAAAVLAVLQFLQGAFGLFPWIAPLMFRSAEYDAGISLGFRASSIFGEPSWAARYYVHWIALTGGYWWVNRDKRYVGALVLFGAAFYVANSLLGYVILTIFVLTFALAQMWRRNAFSLTRRQRLVVAAGAYVLVLLWLTGVTPPVPDLLARTMSRVSLVLQGGGGAGNRFDGALAGIEVWKTAPLFGIGLGNIGPHIVQFYTDPAWVVRSQYAADSVYSQLLGEAGLIGLLAFLWFWGRLLWFSPPAGFGRTATPQARQAYAWLRFLQLDLFAQAVGMLSSADYLHPHIWTVVAIALACRTLILREAQTEPVRAADARSGGGAPAPVFAG